jgi:hypothetical protein
MPFRWGVQRVKGFLAVSCSGAEWGWERREQGYKTSCWKNKLPPVPLQRHLPECSLF